MREKILKEFCHPGSQWVIVNGKMLRLHSKDLCSILRVWASFIVQTLEAASNQTEFIVKRCHTLIAILNNELIDVGLLIVDNIKYMTGTSQRTYGHLCIINELCRLAGAYNEPNDVMSI